MYEQPYNPYAGNVSIIKGYFKKGTVLALGIAYLISAVINVWVVIESSDSDAFYLASELIEQFLSEVGLSSAEPLWNTAITSSVTQISMAVVTFISAGLVPLLCALAFFLVFGLSRSSSDAKTPASGLMILRVLAIISYVITLIAVILLGILYGMTLVTFIVEMNRTHSDLFRYGLVGLIVIGVILTVIAAILLAYMRSRKNFYRAAGYSLNSQNLYKKGAGKFGVYCVILAVCAAIRLISSFSSTGFFNEYFDVEMIWIDYLPNIISIVIYILTAVLALGYKSYINRYLYGYAPAPYDATPMNGGYPPEDNAYQPPMYQTPFYEERPNSQYDDDYDDRRYH